MSQGTGIKELLAAETRASQIVAEARTGALSIIHLTQWLFRLFHMFCPKLITLSLQIFIHYQQHF